MCAFQPRIEANNLLKHIFLQLKNRYGQFYRILLTTELETEIKARKLLEKLAPDVRLINTLAGTATYEVPRKSVKLSDLFSALATNKQRLRIKDWGVSNTSTTLGSS